MWYLRGWLQHHPKYGTLVPGDVAERLNSSEVSYRLGANWYHVAYNSVDGPRTLQCAIFYIPDNVLLVAVLRILFIYLFIPKIPFSNKLSSSYSEFLFLQVENLFQEAARLSPEDSDVHTVLGVLYNLSRNYDKAISSFERALQLKPRDYSLWNKLGATQANSSRSAEAIYAYQEVSLFIS